MPPMEVHAGDVEAVDVRGDDGEEEEGAVEQAVVFGAREEHDGEWGEEDVEGGDEDAVGDACEGPHGVSFEDSGCAVVGVDEGGLPGGASVGKDGGSAVPR